MVTLHLQRAYFGTLHPPRVYFGYAVLAEGLFWCPAPTACAISAPLRFESATEFLTLVALKRGKLGKGGAPDHDAAARAVLQEWNAGTIAYHSEPPKQKAEVWAGTTGRRLAAWLTVGGLGRRWAGRGARGGSCPMRRDEAFFLMSLAALPPPLPLPAHTPLHPPARESHEEPLLLTRHPPRAPWFVR